MSFLSRVSHNALSLDVRHGHGLASHAIETGEVLGSAYLSARINTQYGEKAKIRGLEATYVVGLGLKLAAVAADIAGYGSGWTHHANSLSMGMLSAHFAAKGAADGIDAATQSAPQLKPKVTGIGALPPAPQPGRELDLAAVDRLAAMYG